MKRFILSVLTVCALGTMLASCGSTLKLKGEEPVMNTGRPEVIDYQGLALGSAVPEWVIAIGDGSERRVRKSLDIHQRSPRMAHGPDNSCRARP